MFIYLDVMQIPQTPKLNLSIIDFILKAFKGMLCLSMPLE
jgi:hypothetical protein